MLPHGLDGQIFCLSRLARAGQNRGRGQRLVYAAGLADDLACDRDGVAGLVGFDQHLGGAEPGLEGGHAIAPTRRLLRGRKQIRCHLLWRLQIRRPDQGERHVVGRPHFRHANDDMANAIWQIDVTTGDIKAIIPTKRSRSISPQVQGLIWFTNQAAGTISRVDPRSGVYLTWHGRWLIRCTVGRITSS